MFLWMYACSGDSVPLNSRSILSYVRDKGVRNFISYTCRNFEDDFVEASVAQDVHMVPGSAPTSGYGWTWVVWDLSAKNQTTAAQRFRGVHLPRQSLL